MKYANKKFWLQFILVFIWAAVLCQNPLEHWSQYISPEEAGWSTEKLEDAYQIYDSIGSAALLVIYHGKVVVSWGEVDRRFMCHSVRKSLLSALYGKYVDAGVVDLDKTMAELGIEDIHILSEVEKQARISDLLKARSGVYHPAAYETESMKKARPARSSHERNTFWYYNNWDFNTLCHILMQHSGKDFFQDFQDQFAGPLQMEDFRMEDCYYHLEAENSQFPAYPFRISARDLARLGQLFLQNGKWNDEQILSEDWIRESTTSYSKNTRRDGWGYAYLWWTGLYGDKYQNYSAQGVGNQAIIVFPEEDVVIVNRTNTFLGHRVAGDDLSRLVNAIFEARLDNPKPQPKLKALACSGEGTSFIALSKEQQDSYHGSYAIDDNHVFVRNYQGRLQAVLNNKDKYYMIPIGQDSFLIEDAWYKLSFQRGDNGRILPEASLKRR